MTDTNAPSVPKKAPSGRLFLVLLVALGLCGVFATIAVNHYSEKTAAELNRRVESELRRTGLDRVLSYSKVEVDLIRRNASFHDVAFEIDGRDVLGIRRVRFDGYREEGGVPHAVQIELSGFNGELLERGWPSLVTNSVVYSDDVVSPLVVLAALESDLENVSISIGYSLDEVNDSFSFEVQADISNAIAAKASAEFVEARDLFIDLFNLASGLDRDLLEHPSVDDFVRLVEMESALRSAQDVGLQNFAITFVDQGFVSGWEEAVGYQLGYYNEPFRIADHVYDGRDERFVDIVADIEDVLGLNGLEAVRRALRPNGRLIIESDFLRPIELVEVRYGEVFPHHDLDEVDNWIEDGVVLLHN